MRFLTDFLYLVAVVITSPIWFTRMALRGKLRTDWWGRLGHVSKRPGEAQHRILLHAVSVGEVNALRSLVLGLEQIQDMVMLSQAGSRTGATKGLASPPTAQSDGGDGDGCCESMQLRLDASISTQGR